MPEISVQDKKYQFYCLEQRPSACGIIVFGASGDLTARKIIPSLFGLYLRDLMPENFYVLGCARSEMNDEKFRDKIREPLEQKDSGKAAEFLRHIHYSICGYDKPEDYTRLSDRVTELDRKYETGQNSIFYLAVPPGLFPTITEYLSYADLLDEKGDEASFSRIIIEKPFGTDLTSAVSLNRDLHVYADEHQIYRIDHYLGKETVQNIMMLRFANTVFEPVWNREYIDSVQITACESLGVGNRAGYYDSSGCLRDMFQNHMMQMLTLAAMEPAVSFEADRVRDEKIKVLRSIQPLCIEELCGNVIRGQYTEGSIGGKTVPGYTEEENVSPGSRTETFTAMKLMIDNWRWHDVPFFLRSGKRCAQKLTQIAIRFKHVPHSMFHPYSPEELPPNILILNVQPEDGFSLHIQAKHPGPKLCMSTLAMDFKYREAFGFDMPDAYERLILDCMQGDQTLFIRSDTLETAWALFTPLIEAWAEDPEGKGKIHPYAAGSWGPEAADELLRKTGREWIS